MPDVYSILIIEDNDADAELIKMRIQKLDVSVNTKILHRKKDVLNALLDCSYDLIICDYNLPEINGMEVLKHLRDQDDEIPFILMSGYIGEEKAVDAMINGASDYVLKDNLTRMGPAIKRELINARQRQDKKVKLEKLSMVARQTQDGVVITNLNQKVEWVNEGFTKITGYSLKEITGQKPGCFLHGPDTNKQTEVEMEKRLQNKEPFKGEILYYGKINRPYWVEVSITPVLDENAQVKYYFSILRDITKQKLDQLMGNVHEMVRIGGWEIDLAENKVNWAPSTKDLFEVGPDFEPDIKTAISFFKAGEDRKEIEMAINEAIQNGTSYDLELKIITAKSKEFWVRVLGKPEFLEGKCNGLLGSIQNIDKRKRTEIELEKSLDEKVTLLQEVHHRVKNNLAVVSGFLELQTIQEDDPRLKQKLKVGMGRIKTIAEIHELLYQSESFSHLKLNEVLESLVSKIHATFNTNSRIVIDLNLELVQLSLDQAIPCSLLVNEVFTNALKHAHPNNMSGSIMVGLKEENEKISLSIKDDGVGLPKDTETINRSGSLGHQLIKTLSKQLNGIHKLQSDSQGTEFKLEFKKNEVY